jgi:hypothetical protein
MSLHRSSILFTSLVAVVGTAQAYWIDPVSCSASAVNVQTLTTGINDAFSMADKAYNAIVDIILDDPKKDPNIEALAGYIFGTMTSPPASGNYGLVSGWYPYLQDSTPLQKCILNSHSDYFFKLAPTKSSSQIPDDIRIYCDLSRLTVSGTGDSLKTYDKNNDFRTLGNGVTDCDSSNNIKAWTARQPGFSTVQICPWYLKSVGLAKAPLLSSFLTKTVNAFDKGLDAITPAQILGLAKIDLLALFETTMLHEVRLIYLQNWMGFLSS